MARVNERYQLRSFRIACLVPNSLGLVGWPARRGYAIERVVAAASRGHDVLHPEGVAGRPFRCLAVLAFADRAGDKSSLLVVAQGTHWRLTLGWETPRWDGHYAGGVFLALNGGPAEEREPLTHGQAVWFAPLSREFFLKWFNAPQILRGYGHPRAPLPSLYAG
jgi:hypothetical protein